MAGSDLGSIRAKLLLDIKDFNTKFDQAQKKAEKSTKSMATKMSSFGDKMQKVGKKMTNAYTASVGAFVVASTKLAMNTEKSFAKVNSIAKLSGQEWTNYTKDLKKGANEVGLSYADYAEATYQAISAGVKHTDTVKFLDRANKLAVGGFTDLTKATDVLTTIQNAYGLSAKDTARISDVLIQTQNKGKTTVDELASAMGRVIPTAKANGVSIEQLGASYAIMTAEGIQTAEATTYMNSMFNELGKGGTKVSEVLKKVSGKSFPELMKEGKSVGDVLQILKNYADENNMAFTDLFGSAEAGKAALSLLGEGADKFNGQLEGMKNSTGATDEAFKTMSETAEYKLKKALEQLKNAMSDLGETMIPFVTQCAETATKIIEWANSMIKAHPWIGKLIMGIASFVGIIGPLLTAIGKVISIFGKFGKAISKVGKGFKWLKAGGLAPFVQALKGKLVGALVGANMKFELFKMALKKVATFITARAIPAIMKIGGAFLTAIGPVGWVIMAIIAVIGVFVLLWNKCEWFREFWINLWEKIKDACSRAVEWCVEKFNQFKEFLANFPQHVSTFVDNVVLWFQTLPERIWTWLVNTCTRIGEWVMQLWNQGTQAGSQFLNSVITWFSQLPGRIWEWLVNTVTQTALWVDQMIDKAIEVGSQFLGQLLAWFILLPVRIGEWLWNTTLAVGQWAIDMWNKAYEAGSQFLSACIEWFSQLPGKVWEWLVNTWNKVCQWATDMWNKAQDMGRQFLEKVNQWFSQLPGKIWQWLTNAYNKVVQWATQMWNKAREAGQQFVDKCIQWIRQLPNKVWQWLNQCIQKAIQWATQFAQKGMEGAKNMVRNVINGIKSLPGKVASIGGDIVRGLWNGISGMGGWLYGKVASFAKGVLSSMMGALGIHSPSREARDKVGKWITRGVGVGIMDEYGRLQKQLEKMSYNIVSTLQVEQSDLMSTNNGLLNIDNQRLVPTQTTTNTNQVVQHTTKIDLHIGQFINNRKESMEELMQRMYDYDRDKRYAKGEVVVR